MNPPLTRSNAPAGMPLAAVGGLPPKRGDGSSPMADGGKAPTPNPQLPAPVKASPLSLIIRPSVRDRWQSAQLAIYTPQMIENICRGAMNGNLTAQWQMFDLMEQTWPRLQKNLKELKDAVNDLEWNLQPFALKGQKPTPEAQRRARIIEYILWNMEPEVRKNENDFEDTVFDVLDALGKSISVLEMDIPEAPVTLDLGAGPESFLPIKATRWVHPRYYGYPNGLAATDELMLNAKEVRASNPSIQLDGTNDTDWAPFPDDKFIISVMKQKSGHPINSGMCRILGFFWAAQTFTWEWFLNYSQIFGQPLRWATYDQNALQETITLVEELLSDMGSSGYAAFPAGTDLKLLEAMKGGGQNPQKVLIDAADTICDLVVLNEAMSSEHGGAGGRGGGTQASSTVGKTKRDEKVHAVAGSAAKCLNQQMLKPLCRINFGDTTQCPYLEASAKQSKDSVAVATKYKTLLSIPGVEISKEQFFTDNDLVRPGEGDDTLKGSSGALAKPNASAGNTGGGAGDLEEGAVTAGAHAARAKGDQHVHTDDAIVNHVMENITGVEAKWLGSVAPFFMDLVARAKSDRVSDADLIAAIAKAQKQIPELFHHLDHQALATAIENAMAASAVNGVARGFMDRNSKLKIKNSKLDAGGAK